MLRQVLNSSKGLGGLARLKSLGCNVLFQAKSNNNKVWNFQKTDFICFHLCNQPMRQFSSSTSEPMVKLCGEEIYCLVSAASSPDELSKNYILAFHLNDKEVDLSGLSFTPNQAKELINSLGKIKYPWSNLSLDFKLKLIENLGFEKSDHQFSMSEGCSLMQSFADMGYDANASDTLAKCIRHVTESVLTEFLSRKDHSENVTTQHVLNLLSSLQQMNYKYAPGQTFQSLMGMFFNQEFVNLQPETMLSTMERCELYFLVNVLFCLSDIFDCSFGAWQYARNTSVSSELKLQIAEAISTNFLNNVSPNRLNNILCGLAKFNVHTSHFSLVQLEHFNYSMVEWLKHNSFDTNVEFILFFER